MLLNAHHEPVSCVLPAHGAATRWEHPVGTDSGYEGIDGKAVIGRKTRWQKVTITR
jgi:hypothetical protein